MIESNQSWVRSFVPDPPQIVLTFDSVESAEKYFEGKSIPRIKGCTEAKIIRPEKPRTVNEIRESNGLPRIAGLDFIIGPK